MLARSDLYTEWCDTLRECLPHWSQALYTLERKQSQLATMKPCMHKTVLFLKQLRLDPEQPVVQWIDQVAQVCEDVDGQFEAADRQYAEQLVDEWHKYRDVLYAANHDRIAFARVVRDDPFEQDVALLRLCDLRCKANTLWSRVTGRHQQAVGFRACCFEGRSQSVAAGGATDDDRCETLRHPHTLLQSLAQRQMQATQQATAFVRECVASHSRQVEDAFTSVLASQPKPTTFVSLFLESDSSRKSDKRSRRASDGDEKHTWSAEPLEGLLHAFVSYTYVVSMLGVKSAITAFVETCGTALNHLAGIDENVRDAWRPYQQLVHQMNGMLLQDMETAFAAGAYEQKITDAVEARRLAVEEWKERTLQSDEWAYTEWERQHAQEWFEAKVPRLYGRFQAGRRRQQQLQTVLQSRKNEVDQAAKDAEHAWQTVLRPCTCVPRAETKKQWALFSALLDRVAQRAQKVDQQWTAAHVHLPPTIECDISAVTDFHFDVNQLTAASWIDWLYRATAVVTWYEVQAMLYEPDAAPESAERGPAFDWDSIGDDDDAAPAARVASEFGADDDDSSMRVGHSG